MNGVRLAIFPALLNIEFCLLCMGEVCNGEKKEKKKSLLPRSSDSLQHNLLKTTFVVKRSFQMHSLAQSTVTVNRSLTSNDFWNEYPTPRA
jgi:hypothetical protein